MIDWITGSLAGLSGLGSFYGANVQSSRYLQGVRETNEANKQIAKEQNIANYEQWLRESEWNRKQWEDTNEWNLEQWNRENTYNDPSQQMARMRAAGINPYAALGQLSSGLSASVGSNPAQSASSQPAVGATMQAPQMDAYRTGIPEALQGMMSFAQMRFVNAQAKEQEVKADNALVNLLVDLNQKNALTENYKASSRSINWQTNFNQEMKDWSMKQIIANVANTNQATSLAQTQQSELRQKMSLENARFDLQKTLNQFQMSEQHRMNNHQINSFFKELNLASQRLANDIHISRSRLNLDWQLGMSQVNLNSAEYQKKIHEAVSTLFDNRLKFLDVYQKNTLRSYTMTYLRQQMELDILQRQKNVFIPSIPISVFK